MSESSLAARLEILIEQVQAMQSTITELKATNNELRHTINQLTHSVPTQPLQDPRLGILPLHLQKTHSRRKMLKYAVAAKRK